MIFDIVNKSKLGTNSLHEALALKRNTYRYLVPNTTVLLLKGISSDVIIKKFSPCGNYLYGFSRNQHALISYFYQLTETKELLNEFSEQCRQAARPDRSTLDAGFGSFFEFRYETILTFGNELLCKDFCLFIDDYLLLASALPSYLNTAVEHGSVEPLSFIQALDDISFLLIDSKTGKLVTKLCFLQDYIFLSHHSGVSYHNGILAITSIQNQWISFYRIVNNQFVFVEKIGRALYPEDSYLFDDNNGLKQAFLNHLFRISRENGALKPFWHEYDKYESAILWKAQLIDNDHLLIRLGSPDYISGKTTDISSHESFYMFWNISKRIVIAVFDNASPELLDLYIRHMHDFSPEHVNSIHDEATYKKHILNMKLSKPPAKTLLSSAEIAVKKALSVLPVPCQSYSSSPFFDTSLFRYDTTLFSPFEKMRLPYVETIKIFDRKEETLSFSLVDKTKWRRDDSYLRAKMSVQYVAHPEDPFIIAVISEKAQIIGYNLYYRK